MTGEITIHSEAERRLRRPATVAVLSLATLGLYSGVWYYKVNREMHDYGSSHGDRELGSTKPWASVLALTIGGFVVIPRLVSLVRTITRLQAVERIATGADRRAHGLQAGVVAAALLPVGASVRNFSSVFALAGFVALVSSITAIQARLNRAWRADGSTSSHRAESLVEDRMTATRYEAPTVPRGEPRTRGRSAQDLLDRIDRERKARLELEQAR